MRFSMLGLIQYLMLLESWRPAVCQRDAGAGPEQLQRRNRRRVLGPHHQHVVPVVGVRLPVIVDHLVQLFSRHFQHVGAVIVAGGENHLLSAVAVVVPVTAGSGHLEVAVGAVEIVHLFVLPDFELVQVRNPPVILQRFAANRLLVERGHRNVADFQQLGRGEEHHVGGVVVERVHHAALIDQKRPQAAPLQLDAAGQSGGAGAHHDGVVAAHSSDSTEA